MCWVRLLYYVRLLCISSDIWGVGKIWVQEEHWRGFRSGWTARYWPWRLFFRVDANYSRFACAVNRWSQWFIDHFVLYFQLSNILLLFASESYNDERLAILWNFERSPKRHTDGERGMLRWRILDSSPLTPDQNCLTVVRVMDAWKCLFTVFAGVAVYKTHLV